MTSPRIDHSDLPPSDWREFAATRGLFYHDPRWLLMLREQFGYPLHCLTARRDGEVAGLLAVAEVPGLFGPRRWVSLPFSYAAGPCSDDPEIAIALMTEMQQHAVQAGIRRLEIKHGPDNQSPAAPGFERVTRYAAYVLPTDGTEADLMARLSTSARRGVRKAEREGVTVVGGSTTEHWLVMAGLQERTARGHGIPAPPRRFFSEGCRMLQGEGLTDLLLACDADGRPVAGIVLYKGTGRWIYAFGASLPEADAGRPTHALLWEAARRAQRAGALLDLGRAAPEQTGLVEFKRRWGGVPCPLAYDVWPAAGGLHLARRDRGAARLVSTLWSRLPLAVTRRAAPLFRYLG